MVIRLVFNAEKDLWPMMCRCETCLALTTNLLPGYLQRLEVKRLLHLKCMENFIVLYLPFGGSYGCAFSLVVSDI